MDLRLVDGSRICIIGGGPAGSFSALHLLHLARLQNLHLDVTIFEPRDFNARGPKGCKGCAGILSSRLLQGLASLDIDLPGDIVQSELHSYSTYLDDDQIRIEQPDSARRIVSVYRGAGPHLGGKQTVHSFDGFLLQQACDAGARHIPSFVTGVTQGDPLKVSTSKEHFSADLLVLATGVSSNNPLPPAFGYRGPRTRPMIQDEIPCPPSWARDDVQVHFRQPPGLIFGVLTPKGRYLNVSLLGRGLTMDAIGRFIESAEMTGDLLAGSHGLCGCAPSIANGPARHYYGDHWVAVGDAAATRLYKDGIGSAFFTSKMAMETALNKGISRASFNKHYAPYCRKIQHDNLYGKVLFRLWEFTVHSPGLLAAWRKAISHEAHLPPSERAHMRILWGMLTGDEPYKDLARLFFRRSVIMGLWGKPVSVLPK